MKGCQAQPWSFGGLIWGSIGKFKRDSSLLPLLKRRAETNFAKAVVVQIRDNIKHIMEDVPSLQSSKRGRFWSHPSGSSSVGLPFVPGSSVIQDVSCHVGCSDNSLFWGLVYFLYCFACCVSTECSIAALKRRKMCIHGTISTHCIGQTKAPAELFNSVAQMMSRKTRFYIWFH